MTSAVYRQASDHDPARAKLDPDNRLLWRFAKRRLEAEAIRDSVLSAAGTLNRQMYGPGVRPRIHPSIIATGSRPKWPTVTEEGPEHWRRSVYIFVKRSVLMPMMEGFDAPTATQPCERRLPTTVAPQALQLLNGQFIHEQAAALARRAAAEAGTDPAEQVETAYWLVLSRPPTDRQRQLGVEFLRGPGGGLAGLCHVLLNLNEFVYVD
jgi:hypothetical protein